MMAGILVSLGDAEAAWRHSTVGSDAAFVIAVAATAEVIDIAIVVTVSGHIGLGSILTTLAESAGTFAFEVAFAFTFDACHG